MVHLSQVLYQSVEVRVQKFKEFLSWFDQDTTAEQGLRSDHGSAVFEAFLDKFDQLDLVLLYVKGCQVFKLE